MKPQLNKQLFSFLALSLLLLQTALFAQGVEGYYRFPNIHNNTVVFTAEGDIWTVPLTGGLAQRLTTHAEEETDAAISPDGTTIAFSASYEGPQEIYTMPISGGLPTRWTYEGDASTMNCWTPDGKVVYDTRAYATLPDRQLVTIDPATKKKSRVPLAQASEASFDTTGKTVFFVRPSYHGNVTKRYKGGTARQIWKYTEGSPEAVQLTLGYAGESHHPMWYDGRVYFITDRDGTMNIWSIDENGGGLTQHTTHENFDVRDAGLHNGHIVYQWGADIWHYSIPDDTQTKIDIRIPTDLDQLRERWVDNPAQYISSVSPDKEGDKIVITARGRVFAVPVKSGRTVEFTDKKDVRYRDAVFSADGKNIYTLSDESGEFEFISMPANGIGAQKAITKDGTVLRYKGTPSPDGKWLAYDDLERHMFILNLATGVSKRISTGEEGIGMFSWSPDSKWIAFVQSADNTMDQIFVSNVDTGDTFPITTDRANSLWPAWSLDGKFIYFLSDRSFTTLVGSPWGARQPEPYFDASEKIYHISLQKGTRSPFRPDDELAVKTDKPDSKEGDKKEEAKPAVAIKIDKDGITQRIEEVPVSPGNYRGLEVTKKGLYMLSRETGVGAKTHLGVVKITNDDPKLVTMIEDINGFNLTGNGEKMLVVKQRNYYMVEAGTSKVADLNDKKIDLSGWKFAITPKEDWEQIFTDAWRMERDYFYDKNMHGVNWDAMHAKYLPLVDRVTTREELSDLIGRFVGELSALHTSVRGGDTREDELNVVVASLGAIFSRDDSKGGYSIDYIYKADPDYPDEKSPLDDPYLDIKVGDVITSVNGKAALSAVDIGELIRNQAGKQVRMSVKRGTVEKDVIVVPMSNPYSLRYRDWEYSRRLEVDKATAKSVGYVHLQAMGSNDLEQWYREFYPVFDRQGLIIDVRHNRGGNIESFVLEKLLRKAWMYWKSRSGKPYWNMQYAFRGHIVILVDQNTASDGESFADGFKRLELGTAIGTRTWGGEIWLSGVNTLSDGGIARAPMMGVYGPEGKWLVEGHGFEPDIVVDNLPHATFEGEDAQLKAAIEFLQKKIKEDPRPVPPVPAYPDKSFENK
ncbi:MULTISPECIES: S41 family peptidase [unclassified Imperialibacter]|uniref:S41 family peptidase n=1 Tax=unclassified Imperialibacter TaxID=2629706 RepID=UPI001253BC33|nr:MULTISPECIES: S41 family peptidase [unclassified Imperialibacter]CAD5249494.1 Tricorn protease homolog [Imperialibacter sp. 89]CAD5264634.1 Tricorn protease homolog [Imperialibacter sp. 75]VVT06724.1 Tricorn protease homolog [Imperialibacter sp. EC-SDR9]